MDDALPVGGGKTTSDVRGIAGRNLHGQRAGLEQLAQRLTVHRLGDDIGSLVIGADVMDRQYVGVHEPSRRVRLLLEAPQTIRSALKNRPAAP